MLLKHFEQIGEQWRIRPELRKMVDFRLFNLLGDLAPLGQFDIVLCRNVLIYFDLPLKTRILEALHSRIARDGALILGGAESVFGICNKFTDIAGLRGVYAPVTATRNERSAMAAGGHGEASNARAAGQAMPLAQAALSRRDR
jgi:chemotaxis protein methyltransferase CheR